jgi:hypothetical protein
MMYDAAVRHMGRRCGHMIQSPWTVFNKIFSGDQPRQMNSSSFTTAALVGLSGQRHAHAVLYPWRKDAWYQLCRCLGGPQR